MYASTQVKATFEKYSRFSNRNGFTGRDIAEKILHLNGLYDVQIISVGGKLSDHYDPRTKTVCLSESVYNSQSLAAVSVAAHECGHAVQHHEEYAFLQIRHAIVPAVNIVNSMSMPMIMIGALLGGMGSSTGIGALLIQLGILFFSGAVFFQFITLPVEFNASSRALHILQNEHMLNQEEMEPAKKVLRAAALTYVAAAAVALLSLIRLLLVFGGRRDD